MKVLVTGGGGFLGSAVCRLLLRRGHEPVAYQRSPAAAIAAAGATVHCGDICDRRTLAAAAQGCDAVIHTAGKAGVWGDAAEYHRVNVDGTRAVIAACREAGITILVHASSPSIVHAGKDIEHGNESLPVPTHFLAPYPASKARAEILALAANGRGIRTTALRPHLIWGPGDPHILPRLMARVRRGRLLLPGANCRVDTVYVDNAAEAHVDALMNLAGAATAAGRAYFVSNGEPVPQREIIGHLLLAAGIEARIVPVPGVLARVAGAVCETTWRTLRLRSEPPITRFTASQLSTAHWFDITAAQRDFGYRPRISIAEGLERLRAFSAGGPSAGR